MTGDKILSGEQDNTNDQFVIGSDNKSSADQIASKTPGNLSLTGRITLAIEAGGLPALPEDFEDENGDWKIIKSPNPFTILYLDYKQYKFISPEIVKKHYALLEKFWKTKYEIMNTGGNRIAFKTKYGDGTVENSLITLKRAYEKINSNEGIQRYFTEINNVRLQKGEEGLNDSIEHMMLDGSADKAELQLCLERGKKYDLAFEESATIINKKLEEANFKPYGNVSGNNLAERLLSVDWMTEKKITETENFKKDQESIKIQILPGKYAKTVNEIGTILFNDPGEAKEIIKENLLKQVIAQKDMVLAREISSISGNSKDLDAAFFQIVYKLNNTLPFPVINQQKAKNIVELTSMIFENEQSLKAGRDDLKKGYIEIWLKETDAQAYAKLISVRDSSENFDQAFLAMLYSFNPALPYRFAGNTFVKNINELFVEINNNPNKWNAGRTELYNGSVTTWLWHTGNIEIVKKWGELKNNYKSRDVGLEEFLHVLNPKTPYAKITTPLATIEYPKIQSGKTIQTSIDFSLETRGYAEADFSFLKNLPGVSLSEQKLIFNAASGQTRQVVKLFIDSSLLMKGVSYKTALIMDTSAKQHIEIPVTFKIVFPKNAFILEIVKYSALVSAFFILIRFLISLYYPNWLNHTFHFFLDTNQAFTFAPFFALFGGIFFLFITGAGIGIYLFIKYLFKNVAQKKN